MSQDAAPRRRAPIRSHSNFITGTATDEERQLDRRWSLFPSFPGFTRNSISGQSQSPTAQTSTEGRAQDTRDTPPTLQSHLSFINTLFQFGPSSDDRHSRSPTPRRSSRNGSTAQEVPSGDKRHSQDHGKPRARSISKTPGGPSAKLGTFAGVFVPTTLNVLSILMFLRFGFILGQSGVIGMMGMLIACYAINLLTTMSVSAIATNGTVRGGGAYYLISRSLGPEFGGSIGIVFYIGCVFNTGMNAVGMIDCLQYNFGATQGGWSRWLPDGLWWSYLWATVVLLVCTAICLAGSSLFARASNGLLVVLLVATFSIPISTLFMSAWDSPKLGIEYTGLSYETFVGNLMPRFTKGADGSQLEGKETWRDLFGILFPATGGIFAGASMSGDLKHPSKAIPKGTLYGLGLTFVSYTVVILALAATVTRASFYRNVNVIQDVNLSGIIVLMGEFATSFFSALMGVIGSAKLLQALARDKLIPGLSIFSQGTKGNDEPTYAILITYAVAQLTMLADINQIASFVTMTYLLTFMVTNLACFLLSIGSAPNFRPSFHFYNWQTAFFGTVVSGAVMFFVDQLYAAVSVGIMSFIFLLIHYTSAPKSWGDVSQSLIYHQVRKYLLRLRSDHIKFWRPSVLLLINDPRRQYKLIQFCNSLKKGGLFILGHAIVTQDFAGAVAEAKRQQNSWQKYIDFSKIKAFVNIAITPALEWGARNIVLGSGLGGMRPNIVVMGFFNLNDLRKSQSLIDIPSPQPSRPSSVRGTETDMRSPKKRRVQRDIDRLRGNLPTDVNRPEGAVSAQSYMTVLEDLLLRLQINVAIGKGFQELELPAPRPSRTDRTLAWMGIKESEEEENIKKYIDLWPIQMSAEIAAEGDDKRSVLTSNFDTYTLILQLGCILDTVPSWKRAFKLRVCVFVEYESDVDEERTRVTSLLNNLRIQAEVLVFWLASGSLPTYEVVVNGKRDNSLGQALHDVNEALEDEEWWQEVQNLRGKKGKMSAVQELAEVEGILGAALNWPSSSFQQGRLESNAVKFEGLRKIMRKAKRRASVSGRGQFSGPMRAQSSSLSPSLVEYSRAYDSASESSSSSGEDNPFDDDSDDLAASENDADEYLSDHSAPVESLRRSRSMGNTLRPSFLRFKEEDPTPIKPASRASSAMQDLLYPKSAERTTSTLTPSKASASDNTLVDTSAAQPTDEPAGSRTSQLRRPGVLRHQSLPKFSSKPVPATQISAEEGDSGSRSIMFAEQTPELQRPQSQSIYTHQSPTRPPASGFPAQQAVPLTFNDLPCRAQHLILNDLMVRQSDDSAVLLTTLPSPIEGTCESEADSVRYLSDLEVLCQNLPPVLLLHSNSMTVTMNL